MTKNSDQLYYGFKADIEGELGLRGFVDLTTSGPWFSNNENALSTVVIGFHANNADNDCLKVKFREADDTAGPRIKLYVKGVEEQRLLASMLEAVAEALRMVHGAKEEETQAA